MNRNSRTLAVIALSLCAAFALASPPQRGISSHDSWQKPTTATSLQTRKAAPAARERPALEPAKHTKPASPTNAEPAARQGGDACADAFPIPALPFDDTGTTVIIRMPGWR